MFLILSVITCSLIDDLETANNDLLEGRLVSAHSIYQSLYKNYPTKPLIIREYTKYLLKTGQYGEILRIHTNKALLKQDNLLKYLYDRAFQLNESTDIEELYRESPFNFNISLNYLKENMKTLSMAQLLNVLEKTKKCWPGNVDIEELHARILILNNNDNGFVQLKKIGRENGLEKVYQDLVLDYKKITAIVNLKDLYTKLQNFLSTLNKAIESDSFYPSIFHALKKEVWKKYIKVGIDLGNKGLSYRANEIYNEYGRKEEDLYLYLRCLIIEGKIDTVKKEMKFENKSYLNDIVNRLSNREKEEKERKEREEKQKKNEEKKKEQRKRSYWDNESYDNYGNYGKKQQRRKEAEKKEEKEYKPKKNGKDYKGYYKLLNVPTDASSAEIKKSYRKLLKANNPNKFAKTNKKEYERRNNLMMDINKAKEVLLDDKKRKKYDEGTLDRPDMHENFEGFENFGFGDLDEIFKMFGGQGGTQTFYWSSGGNSGRRTTFRF